MPGSVKGRVCCIMHGGCYFHHMMLLGVIVVPALSAQIAAHSQIAVVVFTLTPSVCSSPDCRGLEIELVVPAGSIKPFWLQSGVGPLLVLVFAFRSKWDKKASSAVYALFPPVDMHTGKPDDRKRRACVHTPSLRSSGC